MKVTSNVVSMVNEVNGAIQRSFLWPDKSQLELLCSQVAKMANLSSADGATAIRVVASPYRICPIGAHIDHQGGPVTAMAISAGVLLGFVPSKTSEVRLRSNQFRGEVRFSIDAVPAKRTPEKENEIQIREAHSNPSVLFDEDIQEHHEEHEEEKCWGNFIRGAAVALKHRGYELDQGIIGVVDGTRGLEEGGVSSSAAVGVACLLALENANGIYISAEENIELDRLIENGYLGLRNGILDQSAILLSRQNCLTVIDCKERTHMLVKSAGGGCNLDEQEDGIAAVTGPGDGFQILLAFSGLKKALTSTPGYNRRVDECCEAARILMKAAYQSTDEKPLLGNITMEEYTAHKEELGEVHSKRAAHFFGEVQRVYRGLEEWKCGNLAGFGKLVSESGASSINNYECGCEPLIQLREILLSTPGVLGARFSGAGFRGCCVALVKSELAEQAAERVCTAYAQAQTKLVADISKGAPIVMLCESADGARILQCPNDVSHSFSYSTTTMATTTATTTETTAAAREEDEGVGDRYTITV